MRECKIRKSRAPLQDASEFFAGYIGLHNLFIQQGIVPGLQQMDILRHVPLIYRRPGNGRRAPRQKFAGYRYAVLYGRALPLHYRISEDVEIL